MVSKTEGDPERSVVDVIIIFRLSCHLVQNGLNASFERGFSNISITESVRN